MTIAVCFFVFGLAATVEEPDSIKKKLDEARAAYESKTVSLREKVLEALDAVKDRAEKSGNKELIKRVAAQLEQFEKYGIAPKVVDVGKLVEQIEKSQKDDPILQAGHRPIQSQEAAAGSRPCS